MSVFYCRKNTGGGQKKLKNTPLTNTSLHLLVLNQAFCALSFVCVYICVCRLRGSRWWHPMSFEAERLAPQHQEHHSLVPGSFL